VSARPVAVDIFAGCGGLTAGVRDGGFRVAAAVELDQVSAATYRVNHKKTKLIVEDVRRVSGKSVRDALDGATPDLVMGCAPCQGFCSLTRKNHREDPRNALLLDLGRLVGELLPAAVMMENVPGLLTRGRAIFESLLVSLRDLGYYPTWEVVQFANYGVPQSRRRLVLLAGQGFAIPIPAQTHARVPSKDSKLLPWVTVRDAIGDRRAPVTVSKSREVGGPERVNWHVVRDLQCQTRARLRAARAGGTWLDYDEEIRPECHRDGYVGFRNVYGRMAWDNVAPTITGGCTTPAKGRFGHPDRRRVSTISVREAALLQTFPADYSFETDRIDAVCEMIGNAVPPRFATAAARIIRERLAAHRAALRRAPV
jgi:DNA (cytosine-5)-methyltransferase 1